MFSVRLFFVFRSSFSSFAKQVIWQSVKSPRRYLCMCARARAPNISCRMAIVWMGSLFFRCYLASVFFCNLRNIRWANNTWFDTDSRKQDTKTSSATKHNRRMRVTDKIIYFFYLWFFVSIHDLFTYIYACAESVWWKKSGMHEAKAKKI